MKNTIFLALSALLVLPACGPAKKTAKVNSSFDKQGHRGSRGLMPENTIPAMLKAIDLGMTTLEMDVVISRDRQVVVSHDVFFHENITTTPEGKTLTKAEAARRLLYTMDYDSIRRYDVGLKPHPAFPRQQKIAAYKPLLSDLIEAAEKHAGRRSLGYNIEIKSKEGSDGTRHPPVREFAQLLLDVVRRSGTLKRTTIQSFDPRALRAVHELDPSITLSLLVEGNDRRSLDEQFSQLGFTPQVYSPNYALVTADLLRRCHDKGIQVIPWTVNSEAEMKRLKELGVDGIITDYPDLLSRL